MATVEGSDAARSRVVGGTPATPGATAAAIPGGSHTIGAAAAASRAAALSYSRYTEAPHTLHVRLTDPWGTPEPARVVNQEAI